MRTTLTLDDDVLEAAKVIGKQKKRSIGNVISALIRKALQTSLHGQDINTLSVRNGFPLLPQRPGGAPVDLELVNSLRDD